MRANGAQSADFALRPAREPPRFRTPPMTRRPAFACTACGATHSKWSGRCDACGAWNTIVEDTPLADGPAARTRGRGRTIPLADLASTEPPLPRTLSGIGELDRVLGGGLVPASAILVGGDPGIGKSTLLLQAAAAFAAQGQPALYVSGEEATAQIRMRAQRLGLAAAPLKLATETSLRDIIATLEAEAPPSRSSTRSRPSGPTPSTRPRARSPRCAPPPRARRFAKRRGTPIVLVGHVTKDGQIAGPRVVEHMVDAVLYFEGERGHQFRILRAVKNRFGPTDEIGVFEMTERGPRRGEPTPPPFPRRSRRRPAGSAVFAGIEGTRPLLVEIQALVAPPPPTARRAAPWSAGTAAASP